MKVLPAVDRLEHRYILLFIILNIDETVIFYTNQQLLFVLN